MSDCILVTGATGNVGKEVVLNLAKDSQIKFKAAVRNTAKPIPGVNAEVELVELDFLKPVTFQKALNGVTRLFLVRPPAISNIKRDITPFLDVAKAAGVKHIVFLSIIGVEQNTIVPHYKIEQEILRLGFEYTFLRAGFFMQNLNESSRQEIAKDNMIFVPAGQAKVSFVDVRDIGEAAAKIISQTELTSGKVDITGPEAITFAQIATELSQQLGRKIVYKNPNPLSFYLYWRKKETLIFIFVMYMLYFKTRKGQASMVNYRLREILGRNPRNISTYIQDYLQNWVNG